MSSRRPIWFQLIDSETGEPYKSEGASKVKVSSSADVDDFRNKVKKKDTKDNEAAVLTPFKSSQLVVYKNKAAFDKRNADVGKEEPLVEDTLVTDLGKSRNEALIVVVPQTTGKLIF